MKSKKQQILDYRIILKPDKRIGKNNRCYVALCPTLGLADDGETAQEALANIKSTIIFHLDCLQKEHKEIPTDNLSEEQVTNTQIKFTPNSSTRFAF